MEINRLYLSSALLLIYLAIITLLIVKRKKLGAHISYFTVAMVVVFLSEFLSTIAKTQYGDNFNATPFMAGGIIIVFFTIVFIYFYKILKNKTLKKLQLAIIILNSLNIIISLIMVRDFFVFLSYPTYFITIIFLLLSVTLFLIETFNSEKILNIEHYYPFWIAISLVVLYVGLVPLIVISKNSIQLSLSKNIFFILLYSVNFTGYAIMFTGIFFGKNENLIKNNY